MSLQKTIGRPTVTSGNGKEADMEVLRYSSHKDFCQNLLRQVPEAEEWGKGQLRTLWEEHASGTRHFVMRKRKFESVIHRTAVDVVQGDVVLRKRYETRDGLIILPRKHDDCRLVERMHRPLENPSCVGERAVERVLGFSGCAVLFSSQMQNGLPEGYVHKSRTRSWEYPGLSEISHTAERLLMLGADVALPKGFDVEERGAVVHYEWEPGESAPGLKERKRA